MFPYTPRRHPSVPTISPLPGLTRQCLRTLAHYTPPADLPNIPVPRAKRAAVLVALFIGRMGDIYVLLIQRALTLRSYAGDTALPGGKFEKGDRNAEDTARREAWEEIGLPRDKRRVPLLCTMEPFVSGNNLIVTPVVVLVTDAAIRPIVSTLEVSALFSHPLLSFLSSTPPFPLPPTLDAEYHTHTDLALSLGGSLRMHRFLTGRESDGIKPVYGLTAAICIRVAEVGFGRGPGFEKECVGQVGVRERIERALKAGRGEERGGKKGRRREKVREAQEEGKEEGEKEPAKAKSKL